MSSLFDNFKIKPEFRTKMVWDEEKHDVVTAPPPNIAIYALGPDDTEYGLILDPQETFIALGIGTTGISRKKPIPSQKENS